MQDTHSAHLSVVASRVFLGMSLLFLVACSAGSGAGGAGGGEAVGGAAAGGMPAGSGPGAPVGNWRLVAYPDVEVPPAVRVSFDVTIEARFSGEAGCNGYFGQWNIDVLHTVLGPVASTRRMCEPELMELEGRYLETLARVGGWRPTADGMLLTDAAGMALLHFVRDDG